MGMGDEEIGLITGGLAGNDDMEGLSAVGVEGGIGRGPGPKGKNGRNLGALGTMYTTGFRAGCVGLELAMEAVRELEPLRGDKGGLACASAPAVVAAARKEDGVFGRMLGEPGVLGDRVPELSRLCPEPLPGKVVNERPADGEVTPAF
jgi:hypothetical protein